MAAGHPPPTLRQLELLLALEASDSIAGAGAKLGMTASATSHALRALETALGVAVVDRNASGVALTYAGQQVLPHARDVFASLQLIQATALASAGLKTGLLRLGSFGPSSSLRLLPPLLERFRARYPGVQVLVTEKPDAEIERELAERRIEMGVVTLPQAQFDTLPLGTDELVAVLPQGHPLDHGEPLHPRELAPYPLVLTHAGSQGLVTQMFERHGLAPHVAHELSQVVSILEFVARGQGVSVIASLALPERHAGVVFRPIAPRSARRVGLACLDEARLSPAARAFWQMARVAAAQARRTA
jgi:DNA-binding transcriptional LysR family regulator